jgi:trigger factor
LHSDFTYDPKSLGTITKYIIKVEEADVNETIEKIRSQYGKMESVETSEKGDFVYGDLKAAGSEEAKAVTLPTNKVEESEVNQFVGLKKDQTINFDLKKIFGGNSTTVATFLGISKDEAEAISGQFELKVTDIKRTQPAELNQEFFDMVFGKETVKSEEEFVAKVRETLQKNFDAESDSLLTKNVYDTLIEKTSIELPADFIKEYLFIINQGKFEKDQIDKDYEAYSKEIKWGIIRNKIVKELGYKVTDNDLKEEARKIMTNRLMQYGGGLDSPEMGDLINSLADNYLKQDNGKNVNGLVENILFTKTIANIKENITIQEKEVNKEEFTKLASN